MALYDLAAKSAGQPLYRYLGGSKRAVETDMTIGIGTPEEMSRLAIKYKEDGARILKIKLGKEAEADLDRMRHIRAAAGDELILRIDANQGWDFETAVHCLNGMADLNIEFCEQPMRTWYDDLLPELRRRSSIKIMADESC